MVITAVETANPQSSTVLVTPPGITEDLLYFTTEIIIVTAAYAATT
jgi:hypothetical protein